MARLYADENFPFPVVEGHIYSPFELNAF